eukprot:jgi/Ulvmu1/3107/UM015_0147.1
MGGCYYSHSIRPCTMFVFWRVSMCPYVGLQMTTASPATSKALLQFQQECNTRTRAGGRLKSCRMFKPSWDVQDVVIVVCVHLRSNDAVTHTDTQTSTPDDCC